MAFTIGRFAVGMALALAASAALAESAPIAFESTPTGVMVDPTGLWSDAEVAEGGSDVQPSVHYATFAVDGGEVTLSILVDTWCSLSECPYRFRLTTGSGLTLHSHAPPDYGMICQDTESMTYDPVELTMTACTATIDFKTAR
jgi:hypothetical protein